MGKKEKQWFSNEYSCTRKKNAYRNKLKKNEYSKSFVDWSSHVNVGTNPPVLRSVVCRLVEYNFPTDKFGLLLLENENVTRRDTEPILFNNILNFAALLSYFVCIVLLMWNRCNSWRILLNNVWTYWILNKHMHL